MSFLLAGLDCYQMELVSMHKANIGLYNKKMTAEEMQATVSLQMQEDGFNFMDSWYGSFCYFPVTALYWC